MAEILHIVNENDVVIGRTLHDKVHQNHPGRASLCVFVPFIGDAHGRRILEKIRTL